MASHNRRSSIHGLLMSASAYDDDGHDFPPDSAPGSNIPNRNSSTHGKKFLTLPNGIHDPSTVLQRLMCEDRSAPVRGSPRASDEAHDELYSRPRVSAAYHHMVPPSWARTSR